MKNLFLIALLMLFAINVSAQKIKPGHRNAPPKAVVLHHPSDKGQAQAELSRNKHKNKAFKHKKKHHNHKHKSDGIHLQAPPKPRAVGIRIPAPPKPGQLPPRPPQPRHHPLSIGK